MIVYAPAKVNIGLKVLNKRKDSYHNLDSIFYPIPIHDIIEINVADGFSFASSGIPIDGAEEDNLVYKAYRLMQKRHNIPGLKVHLHKVIPMGAGLGGGSSDAASVLMAINDLYVLNLEQKQLADYAVKLGADCPFFIYNRPMRVTGIGDVFQQIDLSLEGYYLLLIRPKVHISTAQAYSGVVLEGAEASLDMSVLHRVDEWRMYYNNSFENHLFKKYPLLSEIKNTLYDKGAIYASMSGSGSSIFGIFEQKPTIPTGWSDYQIWSKKL